jgi:hypothetical protein
VEERTPKGRLKEHCTGGVLRSIGLKEYYIGLNEYCIGLNEYCIDVNEYCIGRNEYCIVTVCSWCRGWNNV